MNIEQQIDKACAQIGGSEGETSAGVERLLAVIGKPGADSKKVNFCVGEGYRKLGKSQSALAFYERVLQANGQHVKALRGAAAVAVALGKPAQALSLYERLLKVAPNDSAAIVYIAKHKPAPPK